MNKIVAVSAAAAVPVAAPSIAAERKINAPLQRAEEMVKVLREEIDWSTNKFDEQAAETMLNYFRENDIWADETHMSDAELDKDSRKFNSDVRPFFERYNQPLDWVVRGDLSSLLCDRACRSVGVPVSITSKADRKLVATIGALTEADKTIEQLHQTYGDQADSRRDYNRANKQRLRHIEHLIETPAVSWAGIQAKAKALRSEELYGDYMRHQDLAVSMAEDISRLGGNAPSI